MTFARLFPRAGRASAVFLAAAFLFNAGPAMSQSYSSMSCAQLWYARNAIFAENGYCFQTSQAISVFGPACFPPYGKLSKQEQKQVDAIRAWEKRKGCN